VVTLGLHFGGRTRASNILNGQAKACAPHNCEAAMKGVDAGSPPQRRAVDKTQTQCYVWREGGILVDSLLRKLAWTIVAFAALLLLAPLAASAHEGHPGTQAGAHVAAHHQHATHVEAVAAAKAIQEASARGVAGDIDHDGACTSGCCFGMGCCAGTMLSEIPTLDPPVGPPLLVTHLARPLASLRLTSILEPPNHFA
jgi:hypothetical protein